MAETKKQSVNYGLRMSQIQRKQRARNKKVRRREKMRDRIGLLCTYHEYIRLPKILTRHPNTYEKPMAKNSEDRPL